MPQISQLALVYQSQWLWLVVVLAALFFGVGRGMLPKIEATVDARDKRIADDLAAADRARVAAEATEDAWQARMADIHAEALTSARDAKDRAAAATAERLATAEAAVSAKLAKADAAVAAARKAAVASIEDVAADAARDIVARISGVTVAPADAARAVKEALAHG